MDKLKKSLPLDVRVHSESESLFYMHPMMSVPLMILEYEASFNFFADINDFIAGNSNFVNIKLIQPNEWRKGIITIHRELNKKIGEPQRVIIFRKRNNIFLKPVT